jgi:hypothetical protein
LSTHLDGQLWLYPPCCIPTAWFTQINDASGDITVGGGNKIPIRGVGTISIQIADSKGITCTIDIHDVLFAPELRFNLLSVAKAVKENFKLSFERTQCNIRLGLLRRALVQRVADLGFSFARLVFSMVSELHVRDELARVLPDLELV